jgi:hypothetical protein
MPLHEQLKMQRLAMAEILQLPGTADLAKD